MGLWFETALVDGVWADRVRITHAGGRISGLETGVDPVAGDERGAVALPGLANLHSHAFQRGMAGLAERRSDSAAGDSFWTWREVMYRFLDRLTPDDVEAIAALAFAEMLESGFTRVGEFHYLHHAADGTPYGEPAEMASRIAAAAETAGIGLALLPVFYAHSGFGGAPPAEIQRRFISTLDSFAPLVEGARRAVAPLGDAVVGVAPHSLRAATIEEIAAIEPLAQGGPVHIHIAEQRREVEDCLASHGARAIDWLLDGVEVDARWCLVHATHASPRELRRVGSSGAVVGLCPITEANLGDGLFPVVEFLETNGRIGVGSDSNVLIDAAEELRTLEYGARLTRRGRNLLASQNRASTGARLYLAALSGGAGALGTPRPRMAVGEPLDVVSLDGAHPALTARSGDELLDGWIFAARGGAVDKVWRRGRKVVSSGRHMRREALRSRFRATMNRILAA